MKPVKESVTRLTGQDDIEAQVKQLPKQTYTGANRYDTDDEMVLHLWDETENSYDLRISKSKQKPLDITGDAMNHQTPPNTNYCTLCDMYTDHVAAAHAVAGKAAASTDAEGELEKILADLYNEGSKHRQNYDQQETVLADAKVAIAARHEADKAKAVLRAGIDELSIIQAMLHRPKNYDQMSSFDASVWVIMQAGKIGSRCDDRIAELETALKEMEQTP